jgi:predicted transcriptional regulator YheO
VIRRLTNCSALYTLSGMPNSTQIRVLAEVADAIGQTFGPYCEVVVHDLTRPGRSIVAISNGHVTGRKVGDPMPDGELFELAKQYPDQNAVIGWRGHTADGRSLRSTTVFLRNPDGHPYAALGINMDLSIVEKNHAQSTYLLRHSNYERKEAITAGTVRDLLRQLLEDAAHETGKAIAQFGREDRVRVALYLEERGAFVIRGSVRAAARILGVSRVAMYTYIEEARQVHANASTGELPTDSRKGQVSKRTA